MSKFNKLYEELIEDLCESNVNENMFDSLKSLFKKNSKINISSSSEEFQKIPRNAPIVSKEKFDLYGVNSELFKKQVNIYKVTLDKYRQYANDMRALPVGTLEEGCTLTEKDDNLIWYNKSKQKYMPPSDTPLLLTKSGILVFYSNKLEMIMTRDTLITLDDIMSVMYNSKDNSISYMQEKPKLKIKISKISSKAKLEDIVDFSPGLDENKTVLPSYITIDKIIYMNEKSEIHSTKHPAVFMKNKHPDYYLNNVKYPDAHEWLMELKRRK